MHVASVRVARSILIYVMLQGIDAMELQRRSVHASRFPVRAPPRAGVIDDFGDLFAPTQPPPNPGPILPGIRGPRNVQIEEPRFAVGGVRPDIKPLPVINEYLGPLPPKKLKPRSGVIRPPSPRTPAIARKFPSIEQMMQTEQPYWPFKNHDLLRSGFSNVQTGNFSLDAPVWTFREPDREGKGSPEDKVKVFHSSPIIDEDRNIYIVSTTGWMYSLTADGDLRWSFQMSGSSPGNPALVDGVLFTACEDGWAYAIYAYEGTLKWSKKLGEYIPGDAYSVVGLDDDIIMPATSSLWHPEAHIADSSDPVCGGEQIVAVSAETGDVKWRYNMTEKFGVINYNVMPAIVENSVVVSDASGGVHRLHMANGALLWYTPGIAGTWTTGGMAMGPNRMIYVAHQREARTHGCNGNGVLRALDLSGGAVQWSKEFETALNAAPAVGTINGKLAVVVNAGTNKESPPFEGYKRFILISTPEYGPRDKSTVVVVDAESGDDIVRYEIMEHWGVSANERTQSDSYCFPDLFGTPTIGIDNTIYINWSGGKTFSLHVDKSGNIDVTRSFRHGYGSNGDSAIAPGLLVVPSCEALYGFAPIVR